MSLPDHLEAHLGTIQGGWRTAPDGVPLGFQVVELHGGVPLTCAYATLGLGVHTGQELVLLVPDDADLDGWPAAVLIQVAADVLDRHAPLPWRGLVSYEGALLGSDKTTLYVAQPTFADDAFAVCKEPFGTVAIAWLVPVTAAEADHVRTHGAEAFEDLLVEQEADAIDVFRPPVRGLG